jgi:hypothetical protein
MRYRDRYGSYGLEEMFLERMTPKVSFRREMCWEQQLTCTVSWNGVYMNVDATWLEKQCARSSQPDLGKLREFADALFVKFCFALTERFQANGKPKPDEGAEGPIKVKEDPLMIEGEII